MITTTPSQIAAIRVDTSATGIKNIVIRDNILLGENRKLRIEGPAAKEVRLDDNTGATIENIP